MSRTNIHSDRDKCSVLILSTITDTDANHNILWDRDYRKFSNIYIAIFDKDVPASKQFGWCMNRPSCLLNISNFPECKRKTAKKCLLENNCFACHRCKAECFDDWCDEIVCSCDECEKERFPCQHSKISCLCKLCKKEPDISAIPKELYIFKRLELERCHREEIGPGISPRSWRSKFNPKFLRKNLYRHGPSVVATHFAQERFSEEHLKNIDKNATVEKLTPCHTPSNLNENLTAWKQHMEIRKGVHEFRKKYHRFPPCFRERLDIRSITKVRFFILKPKKRIFNVEIIFQKIV